MNILNEFSQPNGNARYINDDYASYNIKIIMSYIADIRKKLISSQCLPKNISNFNLTCKVCTQSDIESDWSRYWVDKLHNCFAYHRKNWELSYVLQVLYENKMLDCGKKGLGFACGVEKLPSLFASLGIDVTAGDKPDDISSEGWKSSNQYTRSIDDLYYSNIVERSKFDSNVHLEYIDMNNIPENLYNKFDFCWSICAIEHLGSIQNGINFLINSTKLLKSGGISIHTTEFNYLDTENSIDNWGSVLFKREHFIYLKNVLENYNAKLFELDFDYGNNIFDLYIDCPPYQHQEVSGINIKFSNINPPHLKLNIDGFPATCYGLIIKKY